MQQAACDKAGYIKILPRTGTPAYVYSKKCETCTKTHDGSFGAGRFCSSRCARTVGGLAHRKKRQMERSMSTFGHSRTSSSSTAGGSSSTSKSRGSSSHSKRQSSTSAQSRVKISNLLNPSC